MDFSHVDDETLLHLIGQRQAEALAALYDRYARLVFSVAYHALGETTAAEDVAQEVFLQVWRRADSYRPEKARVATWLSSITRYRAIDRLRHRKARGFSQRLPWETVDTTLSNDPDLESIVGLRLQQARVREALQALPKEQQLVLALAYFYGYSQSDIARALDLPLGTVKTRVRLGMEKLRKSLVASDLD